MTKKKKVNMLIMLVLMWLIQPIVYGQENQAKDINQIEVSLISFPISQSKEASNISDQHVTTQRLIPTDKNESVFQLIQDTFKVDINQIKLAGTSSRVMPFQVEKSIASWTIDDFTIKLSFEPVSESLPSGKIFFKDTRKNKNYITQFQVQKNAIEFVFIRNEKNMILVAVQEKIAIESPKNDPEPVNGDNSYATEIRMGGYVIYSKEQKWNTEDLEADIVFYNHAKAVIPSEKGDFILIAEKIMFSKKEKTLIGFNATLTSPDGKTHGNNSHITVPLNDVTQFKIAL